MGQSTTISMIQQMITELHPSGFPGGINPRPPHPPCCNPSSRYHLTVRKDLPPTPQRQLPSRNKLLEVHQDTPKKTVDRLVVYCLSHISSYSVNKYIPGGFFRMSAPMLSFSNTWVGKSHPLKNSKWSRG